MRYKSFHRQTSSFLLWLEEVKFLSNGGLVAGCVAVPTAGHPRGNCSAGAAKETARGGTGGACLNRQRRDLCLVTRTVRQPHEELTSNSLTFTKRRSPRGRPRRCVLSISSRSAPSPDPWHSDPFDLLILLGMWGFPGTRCSERGAAGACLRPGTWAAPAGARQVPSGGPAGEGRLPLTSLCRRGEGGWGGSRGCWKDRRERKYETFSGPSPEKMSLGESEMSEAPTWSSGAPGRHILSASVIKPLSVMRDSKFNGV